MAARASAALPRISQCGRWRPGASSAANCSSASIRLPARSRAGVAVMRATRTTVTTAASCSTRMSDASSRASRPKAPSPCRSAFAGAVGAVQVAGQVSGSANAKPAPMHSSRGSRRQPHGRAVWAAQRRARAPQPGTKHLMRQSIAGLVPNPIARVLCWAGLHRQHGWRSWCPWFEGRLHW
jgi:hypothetical protein